MKFFLFLVLICLPTLAISQASISGRVLDAETLESLPFANIFINHTTFGAAADDKGFFRLSNLPAGEVEVVFSFVGYESYQRRITLSDNQSLELTARLLPDKKLLDNIQVQSKRDKKWDEQLKKFNRVFLGETKNASSCKIINPWVLEFKEGEAGDGDLLFATASEPVQIENLALGYTLTHFLTSFTSNKQSYSIRGNVRFEEMKTNDTTLAKRWEENRMKAYFGSYTHLFRAILRSQTKSEGFVLYSDKLGFEKNHVRSSYFTRELGISIEEMDPSKITVLIDRKNGRSRLIFNNKSKIEVHYQKGETKSRTYIDFNSPVSWIELANASVSVNDEGIVQDPEYMIVSGYMGQLRVADLLPYNYQPEQPAPLLRNIDTLKSSTWKELQEQVYITTDKPYYYPGEVIWFKAFLKYGNSQRMDTLSRVLYMELIDSQKKILHSYSYFIDQGSSFGNIVLPDTMQPGSYFLRSYTRWQRNYGDKYFYIKPIPVLSPMDWPSGTVVSPTPSTGAILVDIKPEKEIYNVREKVSLKVSLKDKDGEALSGNFSVSITDLTQVTPIAGSKNIVDEFSNPRNIFMGNLKPFYNIEYGISLRGTVKNEKQKGKSSVMIIQGSDHDVASVKTDPEGKFMITGFHFIDFMEFAFLAKGKRGKPNGTVVLDKPDKIPVSNLPDQLNLTIERKVTPQRARFNYQLPSSSKMLKSVSVETTRHESNEAGKKHYEPDYILQADWIRKGKFSSLIQALQSKIPGLRIVPYIEDNIIKYTVSFNLVVNSQEPLLAINGVSYFSPDGIYQRLTKISLSSIDHVDVLKFNGSMDYGVRGTGWPTWII